MAATVPTVPSHLPVASIRHLCHPLASVGHILISAGDNPPALAALCLPTGPCAWRARLAAGWEVPGCSLLRPWLSLASCTPKSLSLCPAAALLRTPSFSKLGS